MKRMIAGLMLSGIGIWRLLDAFKTLDDLAARGKILPKVILVEGQRILDLDLGFVFWAKLALWFIILISGILLVYSGYRSTQKLKRKR